MNDNLVLDIIKALQTEFTSSVCTKYSCFLSQILPSQIWLDTSGGLWAVGDRQLSACTGPAGAASCKQDILGGRGRVFQQDHVHLWHAEEGTRLLLRWRLPCGGGLERWRLRRFAGVPAVVNDHTQLCVRRLSSMQKIKHSVLLPSMFCSRPRFPSV